MSAARSLKPPARTFRGTHEEARAAAAEFAKLHNVGSCTIAELHSGWWRFTAAPSPAPPRAVPEASRDPLFQSISEILSTQSRTRWLIKHELERGVIALMPGPRGSYKSLLSIDWSMRVALTGEWVFIVSAEGNDIDRRIRAWLKKHAPDIYADSAKQAALPIRIAQRRLDLNDKESIERIRAEVVDTLHTIKPALFVFDTVGKLAGSLDKNDNDLVGRFIGWMDNGLKRPFDATVLLIGHVGLSDTGRMRGASAWGADTDAEYIVSRRDTVLTLTRSRFKSSAELPPLHFKAEVVNLDYSDEDGVPVTSIVLVPTSAPSPKAKDAWSGPVREALYAALRSAGGWADVDDIVRTARLKPDGSRRKLDDVRASLKGACDRGGAVMDSDGKRVRLAGVVEVSRDEFDTDEAAVDDETVTDLGAAAALDATSNENNE